MTINEIVKELKNKGSRRNIEGMARFGINVERAYGVSNKDLRLIARKIKIELKDELERHQLALALWHEGYHETMILAAFIDQPELVTEKQMDKWVESFNSWAVCDTVCGHLLDKTPFAYKKALKYTTRDEEFVKRAGFVLVAWLAVHDKYSENKLFIDFLDIIEREAHDDRNYVKKAINWSLRQIGKSRKDAKVLTACIDRAKKLEKMDSKSASWIGKNALRELNLFQNKIIE